MLMRVFSPFCHHTIVGQVRYYTRRRFFFFFLDCRRHRYGWDAPRRAGSLYINFERRTALGRYYVICSQT